jgi:hypothetical membrane protein
MSQENISSPPGLRRGSAIQQLSALAGIIAPLWFVLVYTFAGFLRPGYSPVRQVVSDLGRGLNAWILTLDLIVFGFLLLVFIISFSHVVHPLIKRKWLNGISTFLLVITGISALSTGLFPEYVEGDPATALSGVMHAISATSMFFFLGVALLIIGWQLRKKAGWERHGWYSWITGLVTILLLFSLFFLPTAILKASAGLLERIVIMESFAWYLVIGLRIVTYTRLKLEASAPIAE